MTDAADASSILVVRRGASFRSRRRSLQRRAPVRGAPGTARGIHRPGLPASPVPARRWGRRTVRQGASREVSCSCVPSTFAGRAVRSGRCLDGPDDPAAALCRPRAPTLWPARPCGFFGAFTPPQVRGVVRAGHSWPVFSAARVPGPRDGLFSRPGRTMLAHARRRPWDSLLDPSQLFFRLAGERASSASRSHPPAVSPPSTSRGFLTGAARYWRAAHGTRPRLLGFGPAVGPCRSTGRPRYSFCAEGRSGFPAETALGFRPLSGLRRRSVAATSGGHSARGLLASTRVAVLQSDRPGRLACPSAFGGADD
jgi:hypothetical protein